MGQLCCCCCLTSKEDEEARTLFRAFDQDDNGYITRTEMRQVFVAIGRSVDMDEIEGIFHQTDTDGDGQISYQEFIAELLQSPTTNAQCPKTTSSTHLDKLGL